MKDMMKMMQQAKDLQKNLKAAQDELAETVVTGTAASGMVEIFLTCGYELKGVKIKPEAVDEDDTETLEDLVHTALQDALKQAHDTTQSKMGGLTGGLNIPGLA